MKYEVYEDANDILIKKGRQELVLLVSKNLVYIKNRDGTVKAVNENTLNAFFSSLETPTFHTGVRWLPCIQKGIYGARNVMFLIENLDKLKPLIDRGLLIVNPDGRVNSVTTQAYPYTPTIFHDIVITMAEHIDKDILAALVGTIITDIDADGPKWLTPDEGMLAQKARDMLQHWTDFVLFYNVFGYAGGRGILKAFMTDSTIRAVPYDMPGFFPNSENCYALKWERMVEYMTKGRHEQGYTDRFNKFMDDWKDTLRMSYEVNTKASRDGVELHRVPKNEKYPKALESLHRHYSSIIAYYKCHNAKSLYMTRKTDLADYEYTTKDKKYFFRLPESDEDMINEARQQNNCLASYTSAHANGETTIAFMRYTSTPNASLVTIERKGDRIIQKYRAFNRNVSPEENRAINEWIRATNEEARILKRAKREAQHGLANSQKNQSTLETTA